MPLKENRITKRRKSLGFLVTTIGMTIRDFSGQVDEKVRYTI